MGQRKVGVTGVYSVEGTANLIAGILPHACTRKSLLRVILATLQTYRIQFNTSSHCKTRQKTSL